ncbi:hypothetical protein TNCV_2601711 [Trichonephila clavipes]|nr:hypothetical protein TNCV_2601711 [Trichonephila clavipes]
MGKNITILLRKTSARVVWEDFATLIKKIRYRRPQHLSRYIQTPPRSEKRLQQRHTLNMLQRSPDSCYQWSESLCYAVHRDRCLKRAVCSETMIKVLG